MAEASRPQWTFDGEYTHYFPVPAAVLQIVDATNCEENPHWKLQLVRFYRDDSWPIAECLVLSDEILGVI